MMPAATIREVRSSYKSLLCSPNTVSSVRTRRTNHQAQGDKTLIQKPIVVVTMTKSTFSTQSVVYTYIILSLTFLTSEYSQAWCNECGFKWLWFQIISKCSRYLYKSPYQRHFEQWNSSALVSGHGGMLTGSQMLKHFTLRWQMVQDVRYTEYKNCKSTNCPNSMNQQTATTWGGKRTCVQFLRWVCIRFSLFYWILQWNMPGVLNTRVKYVSNFLKSIFQKTDLILAHMCVISNFNTSQLIYGSHNI